MSRRLAVPALTAAVALAASGCGGSGSASGNKPAKVAPSPTAAPSAGAAYKAVPLGGTGATEDQPSGKLVAQSKFDVTRDGFAFANYGRSTPAMRAQEVIEIFGKEQVCANPSAPDDQCVLTPEAERWRIMQNQLWSEGHCFGFSALSLAIFSGAARAADYGGSTAFDLRVADASGHVINPGLDADLTRDAALQTLRDVEAKVQAVRPNEMLDILRRAFENGGPNYILAVMNAGKGGHAVVPRAIEDMGGGRFDVILYDNNWPATPGNPARAERRLHVDTTTNTWQYTLGIRPDVAEENFSGDGTKHDLQLVDVAALQIPKPQDCPFCRRPVGPGLGKTVNTVALTGSAERQGRLRITDAQGHVTGWNGKRYVNQIPGAKVRQAMVINRWMVAPEPRYEIPADARVKVELVDVPQDAPPATMHVSGPGVGIGLSRVTESGTTLGLSPRGAVTVSHAQGGAIAPLLQVAASGDRALKVVPGSDTLRVLAPRSAGLHVVGSAKSATVTNVRTGRTADVPVSPLGSFGSG